MAHSISDSVGQGGRNSPSDVRTVQTLLNEFATALNFTPLTVSGLADTATLAAITAFACGPLLTLKKYFG